MLRFIAGHRQGTTNRRNHLAVMAVLVTLATACADQEEPPSARDGGIVDAEGGSIADRSIANDVLKGPEAAVDATNQVSDASDVATEDSSTAKSDAAAEAAASDTFVGDIVSDSNATKTDAPADAATTDGRDGGNADDADRSDEGGSHDARDSAPEADTGADDIDAATGPIFSTCTYSTYLHSVPSIIIDATITVLGASGPCACTLGSTIAIHRVLCGSPPPGVLFPGVCPSTPRTWNVGERWVIAGIPIMCPISRPFTLADPRPLDQWDVLLAEQIAGHTDGSAPDAVAGDGSLPPNDDANDGD